MFKVYFRSFSRRDSRLAYPMKFFIVFYLTYHSLFQEC